MISSYEVRQALEKLRESGADHKLCDSLQDDIEDLENELDPDDLYDDGYRDGLNECAEEHTRELRTKIRDIIGKPESSVNYGPPRTEKQPRGWVTHNGDFFGFGDTPEESYANYLQKALETV